METSTSTWRAGGEILFVSRAELHVRNDTYLASIWSMVSRVVCIIEDVGTRLQLRKYTRHCVV